jgi:CRP-like cAMP-binding protein
MIERFQGREGHSALLNALRSQFVVDGNTDVAEKIASGAVLREYAAGERVFVQGERGTDIFFVLAGQVSVVVGEIEVATCGPGTHVGEIALLEPFKGRSATVNVIDTTVVAQLSGQKFTEIAAHYPEMWRRIGIELARRLVRLENTVYGGVTV